MLPPEHVAIGEQVRAYIAGIVSEYIANQTREKVSSTLLPQNGKKPTEDWLEDIHKTLKDFMLWAQNTQAAKPDVFNSYVLYKQGQGSPYNPRHTSNRQYFQILSPVDMTVNIQGTAIGTFNLSLTHGVWTNFSYPDGATVIIDASFASNSQVVLVRETNANIL